MIIIFDNDTDAFDHIQTIKDMALFVCENTPKATSLSKLLENTLAKTLHLDLCVLHNTSIKKPGKTLLGFVRFPRLLIYRQGSSITEKTGYIEIGDYLTQLTQHNR